MRNHYRDAVWRTYHNAYLEIIHKFQDGLVTWEEYITKSKELRLKLCEDMGWNKEQRIKPKEKEESAVL